jgi:uncharacterized paraquat-inducible protein A
MLISIFTPAYSATLYPVEEYYWMWGLSYTSVAGYDSRTVFIAAEEPSQYLMPVFLVGFIPFLLILICSLVLVISGNGVRTGRSDIEHRENLWIIMGIIMIVAPIIFIIGIDITTLNYIEYMIGPIPPGYNFWSVYDPGFAVIAPFIGAVLSIAGSIASKKIQPREVPIFARQTQGGIITKTPIGQISHKIKFCSECGHQLLYDGASFCPHCGKAIKF